MNKTWQIIKPILVMVAILLLTLVGGFIGSLFGLRPDSPGDGVYIFAISQLIFAISAFVLIKINQKIDNFISNQGFKKDSWKMIIMGIGYAGFGSLLISLMVTLLADSPLVSQSLDMVETATEATSTFQTVLVFIIAVIVAPVVEEYLFRGYLFGKTNKVLSLPAAAILNGFIFALYHMNILQGVNTFFLAIFLCLVYYYRRNIIDVIIIHMTNNLIISVVPFIPQFAPVIGVINIACIFIGGFFFYKIIKEGKANENINESIISYE